MNIYDFDDTIYDGDTCRDIIKYGLMKHPILTIRSLKKAKKLQKDYEMNLIPFERVKEELLSFIFKIKNYPRFINSFVDSHMKKIKPFYKSRHTDRDAILSASYELWISLFAKRLGINYVIATKTDIDGKIVGRNCKGEEKIRRLKEVYPNVEIACAYSDSSVDIPMLEIAKEAYVVEGNKLITYKRGYPFKNNK